MRKPNWFLLFILLAFGFALYAGVAGVDYGTQWDQNNIKGFVNKYIRTSNILPGEYHYPPVSSYIATTTTIPYALPSLLRYGSNWLPTQSYLLDEVLKNPNQAFLLNLRRVFVFFTLLTVIWVGLAGGQKDWIAGLVAAGLIAFSWEISYHSRVVHPDGPTMQFVALSLLFCLLAFSRRRPLGPSAWLHLAAATAALATATKYTAGLSLLTVLIFAVAIEFQERRKWPHILFRFATLGLTFGLVFLLLVPGAVLEQSVFLEQLGRDQSIYASGHGQQTVEVGWDYLSRVFVYLFGVAFSFNPLLALIPSLLFVLGVYVLAVSKDLNDRWLLAGLLSAPLLYVIFLMTNRVLFVRNLLQILPSLALLAGFGFSWLLKAARDSGRFVRLAPSIALAALFAVNAYSVAYSAWTIQMRHTGLYADQALAAIARAQPAQVYLTPAAQALLAGRALPPNATISKANGVDLVLFAYLGDTFDEDEGNWPVNSLGAAPNVFGPQDINMDWYASWPASERFVLAAPDAAWEEGRKYQPAVSDAPLSLQEATGVLDIDGQQFILEMDDATEIFIMNSANPQVVLALNGHLGERIELTGHPYSEDRPNDWLLSEVDGVAVLSGSDLRVEYNFARLVLGLSLDAKQCLEQALGTVNWQAMNDHAFGFAQLSDDRLHDAAACVNEG